jgi:hypothetical protein
MPSDARLRRDPKLPFQEIEGQAVVVVPARRELHQLDEVGTFVWNSLKEARSLLELADAVCGEFDVERDRAEEDLRAFLASLEEKGLVISG